MNLLILDEPTNHLDLHSKDILLDTLQQFEGTIIFVSHDRSFMEALSTKTLELTARDSGKPAAARLFYGNYGYYLDRVEREDAGGYEIPEDPSRPAEQPAPTVQDVTINVTTPVPAPLPKTILIKAGERRAVDKQRQTLIRRLQRQEEEILKALEELEKEKAQLEGELARPEIKCQAPFSLF
jgi:ATP-binding cassette subfamily F protein 3